MNLLVVECSCGTRFEANSRNAEIVPCVADHRTRCRGEIEWWLRVPAKVPHPFLRFGIKT